MCIVCQCTVRGEECDAYGMSVYSGWWLESLTCIKCVVCVSNMQQTMPYTQRGRRGGQAYDHTAPLDQIFS